jgi:hypothetical protein
MNQTSTFQTVIESVEALTENEQDILLDLIKNRRIAHRRQEILQNATQTMAAIQNSTAPPPKSWLPLQNLLINSNLKFSYPPSLQDSEHL